jgi:hypothetical protein
MPTMKPVEQLVERELVLLRFDRLGEVDERAVRAYLRGRSQSSDELRSLQVRFLTLNAGVNNERTKLMSRVFC